MKKSITLAIASFTLALASCSGDVTASSTPSRIKATFVNYDDSVLYVMSLEYGGTAVYQGDTPTRPTQSESHHYVFTGWDQPLENLKIDTTFIAQYTEKINSYTVDFKDYDDTLLQSTEVEHGSDAVYSGEEPSRPGTPQFSYTFNGWDKSLKNITQSQVIHAQYIESVNQYTVTFKDEDGTVLGTSTVDYGSTAVFEGEEPKKAATEQYHYTFAGWSISLENITEDCDAIAQYNSEINTYTVRFLNYDGTELGVDTVEYDGTAVYEGNDPVKEGTDQYSYAFNGWDSSLEHIKENKDVTAQFTESVNQYTVTFYNDDDTKLGACVVDYGGTAVYEGETPTKESTAKYSYSFKGWDVSLENITKDTKAVAQYDSSINEYTVTFKDYDGSILSEETVKYGDDAFYRGEEPQRAKTAQYTYTFTGWDVSLEGITEDTVATAQYEATINQYTVTFKDYDGTVLYTDTVDYGGTASYNLDDPTREKTDQYTYVFTGWDISLEDIQEDSVATAQYDSTINQYTVTFKDYDGTILDTQTVDYGSSVTFGGETPTRETTAQYTYVFKGWDVSLTSITSDCVATAQYTETINQYTVTFKNFDGTILDAVTVDYGSEAVYSGATPTKPENQQASYSFSGWSISLKNITGNCEAIAQFDENIKQYTVTFKNYDGSVLDTVSVDYGSEAEYSGETPVKPGNQQYTYTFSGWDISLKNIIGECVAVAQFDSAVNQYTVTFKNYDGTYLGSTTVDYGSSASYTGETPTKPATAQYTYVFSGWDNQINTITEDCERIATFNQVTNQYTVTFKNYDGSVLGTSTVDYGSAATYNGSTPTRPKTQQYSYTFNGWDISLTNVTSDRVAIAQYDYTVNQYTVTFKNFDGSILGTSTVDYGGTAKYTGATPTKPATPQYTFTFTAWDKALTNVVKDFSTTAQFSYTVNEYTVTFKNYDGTVLDTCTVAYGADATYSGNTPTKPSSAQYDYTFAGWDISLNTITGDEIATAQFNSTIRSFVVTFKNDDGSVLGTDSVEYGGTASYNGQTPTKASTAQYDYEFTGWNISLENITENVTATAQYGSTLRSYTITWENYDGTTLEQDKNVQYGTNPTYDGSTPTKPDDGNHYYNFTGWSPAVTSVTGDALYTAQFEEATFATIQWVTDGSIDVLYETSAKLGQHLPLYNNGADMPNEITESMAKYFEGWIVCWDEPAEGEPFSEQIHFTNGVAYYGNKYAEDEEEVVVLGSGRVIPMYMRFDYDLRFQLNGSGTGYIVSEGSTFQNHGGYIYIPDTYNGLPIVEIADNAFKDTMNSINPMDYAGVPCIYVSIPGTVTRIGNNAFANSPIGGLDVRGGTPQLVTIGAGAFAGAIYAYHDQYDGGTFSIPSTVTTLGAGAFAGCTAIEHIYISANMQNLSFSGDTFAGCTSLEYIRFNGTKAQWLAICSETTIETDYEPTQFYVKCSDGNITINYV